MPVSAWYMRLYGRVDILRVGVLPATIQSMCFILPIDMTPGRTELPVFNDFRLINRFRNMARLLFYILLFVTSHAALAQDTSPLEVVQRQLDTYNVQDIDGFAAVFAEDAKVFRNIGDTEPAMKGRDEIHAAYGKIFRENPRNKSTLMGRMVQGNFVIDHELITGRDSEFRIVAIYEVKGGLIARAWFVR
jgi:hypothetical protein